jgi:hypothetical protein
MNYWRNGIPPVQYGALVGLIVWPVVNLIEGKEFSRLGVDWDQLSKFWEVLAWGGFLLWAGLVGAVMGAIVGACFKGHSNRGAIIFAILVSVGFAIDKGITVYGTVGILPTFGGFLVEGVGWIVAGALFGRLVVAVVKRVNRNIGFAIHGSTGQAVFGAFVGAISVAFLRALYVVWSANEIFTEAFQSHFVDALVGTGAGTLFGFIPMVIGWGIAGAIAGAVTPWSSRSEEAAP